MGSVIVVFRVLPENPADFDRVKKSIEALKPKRLDEDPIGFGLKAIKMTFIVPDAGNEVEKIESKLESIKGISSIETLNVSRSI